MQSLDKTLVKEALKKLDSTPFFFSGPEPTAKSLEDWTITHVKYLAEKLQPDDLYALLTLLVAIAAHKKTSITPNIGQMANVQLFCKTDGLLQEVLALCCQTENAESDQCEILSLANKSLLHKTSDDIKTSLSELMRDGYTVCPHRLPCRLIEQLLVYPGPSTSEWNLIYDDESTANCSEFDSNSPPIGCIRASTALDKNSGVISAIASDPALTLLLKSYLGATPRLLSARLAYSYKSERAIPSSEAAQLFHYDLDTLRWIKVFIYCSDVTDETGPHCAVLGSQLPGSKSASLLARGYARISDADIFSQHPLLIIKTFTGDRGTVILGDTRCYHKGMPLQSGERVLCQLLFSTNSFAQTLA